MINKNKKLEMDYTSLQQEKSWAVRGRLKLGVEQVEKEGRVLLFT
jgi:hypothetical protein